MYYHVLINNICVLIFTLAMCPRFINNQDEGAINTTKDTEMDQFARNRVQQYLMSAVMHDAFVEYATTEFVTENVSCQPLPFSFCLLVCSVGPFLSFFPFLTHSFSLYSVGKV